TNLRRLEMSTLNSSRRKKILKYIQNKALTV
ncbi:MAG: hypothetical protein ACJA1H_001153, partial [Glaciecola sp.]